MGRSHAILGCVAVLAPLLACSGKPVLPSESDSATSGSGASAASTTSASTGTGASNGGGGQAGSGGSGGSIPSDALDAVITAKMMTVHTPGLSTCVVKAAKVRWCKGYGLADIDAQRPVATDSVFLIASISKTITAATLMQLWEKNRFALDDDVQPYLPFSAHHPTSNQSITFRRLLTHTASVRDAWSTLQQFYVYGGGDPTITLHDAMRGYFDPSGAYYDAQQNFAPGAPGTVFEYSNEGIALAGYAAEAISGTDFAALAKANVLEPLAMKRTSFRITDFVASDIAMPYGWSNGSYSSYGHYAFADYPDGGLFTTAPDLARWLAAFSAGGAIDGERVLEAATVAEMTKEQNAAIAPGQGIVFYHVDIDGSDWIGHSGGESGVATDMFYRASDGLGFVVLMNGDWPTDPTPVYDLEDAIIAFAEALP